MGRGVQVTGRSNVRQPTRQRPVFRQWTSAPSAWGAGHTGGRNPAPCSEAELVMKLSQRVEVDGWEGAQALRYGKSDSGFPTAPDGRVLESDRVQVTLREKRKELWAAWLRLGSCPLLSVRVVVEGPAVETTGTPSMCVPWRPGGRRTACCSGSMPWGSSCIMGPPRACSCS